MSAELSMGPTNYCRHLQLQFKAMAAIPSLESEKKAIVEHVIDLCRASHKFHLPKNGQLLPDDELRALDEHLPLRLPQPFVALEFTAELTRNDGGTTPAKRIIFCREDEEGIYVKPAAFLEQNGFWVVKHDAFIPRVGYLDRSNPKSTMAIAEYPEKQSSKDGYRHVKVVLGFLNALACSNVHIESRPPKRSGKKIKSALPFDTYHFLTIDIGRRSRDQHTGRTGGNRSPREHLRRGHVRRLPDTRRIWVNATVVAANKAAGMVKKDYIVCNSMAPTAIAKATGQEGGAA